MAQILLHGTIHVTIYEVDKLKSNLLHKVSILRLFRHIRYILYDDDDGQNTTWFMSLC